MPYEDPYAPLETRKKQLEAQKLFLMAQASEAARIQNPGQGRMVGGAEAPPGWAKPPSWYVPPSALESLQKPFAQVMNGMQQRALAKDDAAYDAAEKSAASAVMRNIPTAKTVEQPGPPTEEGAYPAPKTVQPTREDKLKWAQEGMAVPSLRQTLEKYYQDQLINEPVRDEARVEKRLDREDRQAAVVEERAARRHEVTLRQQVEAGYKKAELEQRAADAKRRSEDMRYGIDERRAASHEHAQAMKAIAAMKVGAGDAKAAAAEKAKATDAMNVLELLDEAEPLLSGATSSVIGYGRDLALSGIGQSTEAGDKAAKLKSIQGFLVSKMPKMSGPQSDKDVENYKQMAGKLGDPMTPASQKQAALDTIRSLHQKYAQIGGASANYGSSAPALPSGVTVRRVK